MSLDLGPYRIPPGESARLSDRTTLIAPPYGDKDDYRGHLAKRVRRIARLQRALYAERRQALLVILQGVDAAGKDGAIRHFFSGTNPQCCAVHNFEPPSRFELAHDFLWRAVVRLPPHGQIGLFNRSYYEEVLVVRVHPELLRAEGLGEGDVSSAFWEGRVRSILDHEAHLARNGVKVVKVYLHLSREEQRRRFLRRIARPDKHWKLDAADFAERERWDDYVCAYEACLSATSTQAAPWYVLPADDKKTARLLLAQVVLDTLAAMAPRYPPGAASAETLTQLRRRLEAEAPEG